VVAVPGSRPHSRPDPPARPGGGPIAGTAVAVLVVVAASAVGLVGLRVYKGRPASIDEAKERELKEQGMRGRPISPRHSASAGRACIGCFENVAMEGSCDKDQRRSSNSGG
jgi:hypothetical protein